MNFIKANYHTHTTRCHHAKGDDREYVEAAIEEGLDTLGFADHSPYFFDGYYYSHFRMRPEHAAEYVASLKKLKKEYRKNIDIKIGFEAEYYPKYFDKFLSFCRDLKIEYLILGQHYTQNETDGYRVFEPTDDKGILNDYTSQVCEAIETGVFSCVAHPDVLNFVGDKDLYADALSKICRTANKAEIPVEINMIGLGRGRNYPSEELFKAIKKENSLAIIGCDAHSPSEMHCSALEEKALDTAKKYGIKLTDGSDFVLKKLKR